jgi:antitoxin component YwqK of YwqJK toxin-antitoxin module
MEKQAQNLINLYNEKGEKHGYWEEYWNNGKLESRGNYVNGKREGYWEMFHYLTNHLRCKGNYVNGEQDGYWEWYYTDGEIWWTDRFVNKKFLNDYQEIIKN